MNCYDVIVVGSGSSAVSATLGLKGKKILVLDVGSEPKDHQSLEGNLYDIRKTDQNFTDKVLGKNFEGLHNVTKEYLNPKLKSPFNRFITKNSRTHTPVSGESFSPQFSFAKGGMANAWGAGAFEFQNFELKDFPIKHRDLEPFYKRLTKEVGISGCNDDDLASYLGENKDLQPPTTMSMISNKLYQKYLKNKKKFIQNNFSIGKLRLAILTENLGNRTSTNYSNLEFYRPHLSSIYTPSFTLEKLIKSKSIEYINGKLVESYSEKESFYEVTCKDINSSSKVIYKSKTIVLAAGPINTSKIVLKSNKDYTTKLYLQENAISYIPLVDFLSIGMPVEKSSVPASLGMVHWPKEEEPTWISLYCLGGPLKSEYLMDFPLSIRGSLVAAKHFPSAMMIAQVFYPGDPNTNNYLSLNNDNVLHFNFENRERGKIEKQIIKTFRSIGFFGHASLCKMPIAGNSFHYGCNLPMKENPKEYECDKNGKLHGTKGVYIADSSNFSFLPAKNLTFTMMANAMRIGDHIKKILN